MSIKSDDIYVGRRISIIAACFSLPIIVLFYFIISGINASITFAQFELKGNQYQRPLEEFLEGALSYQMGLRQEKQSDTSAKAKVAKAITELLVIDEKIGASLQFTDIGLGKRDRSHLRVKNLQKEWEEAIAVSGTDADSKLDHIIADLRAFITHSGDTSNLILDPDLDSYYLMDVTLLALPQTQDRLGKITNFVADILARGKINPEDRLQAAVHAALLEESDVVRVMASGQTALKEDANFYGVNTSLQANFPLALARYESASKEFIKMTREVANGVAVDRKTFIDVGQQAISSSFKLWTLGAAELDNLINTRIDFYATQRIYAIGLSTIALLVALGLVWINFRALSAAFNKMFDLRASMLLQKEKESDSLNNSIIDILRSVSKLSQGDLRVHAPVREDVTGALADAINSMTDATVKTLTNVNASSELVRAESKSGRETVQATAKGMNEVRGTIQETGKRIKRLGERSQEIGGIVKLIDDIAERTSVLALNANMQAAVAGEAGRGFRVVADEVQRLAERSKEATDQIAKLVSAIQGETNDTIATMERAIGEVVKGGEMAEKAAAQVSGLEKLGSDLYEAVHVFTLPEVDRSATYSRRVA